MSTGLSRHARALWLAMILLTLGGIASALSLPVSLFPQIDYPRVVVSMMPASAMPHKWKRR